jgi:FlaA1/EpsC-like NDP-sugar epimerase
MTVTEAAQLVIQAGAMGKKSEVFILDMGKSIKIIDLIHKMINLSGLSIKDNKNPEGDIEVKITGLRPGEKLYEELLVGENSEKTNHPRIQKTEESFIPFNQLELDLNNLKKLINENKANEVKKLLDNILKLYKSNSQIVDSIYTEQLFSSSLQKNSQLNEEEKNKVVKIK